MSYASTKKLSRAIIIYVYSVLYDGGKIEIKHFDSRELAGFRRSKNFKTVLDFHKLQQVKITYEIKIY